jgi:hypothetical protein
VRSKNFGENFFVDKKTFYWKETTDFYFSKIKKYLLNAYNRYARSKKILGWEGVVVLFKA